MEPVYRRGARARFRTYAGRGARHQSLVASAWEITRQTMPMTPPFMLNMRLPGLPSCSARRLDPRRRDPGSSQCACYRLRSGSGSGGMAAPGLSCTPCRASCHAIRFDQ